MENLIYKINFKRIALTNKTTVRDTSDNVVSYSHQKLLKIKERVLLYADENKTEQIAEINADSIIDYNVQYTLTDASDKKLYTVKRMGRKSIWKAHYEISDANGNIVVNINEKSSWMKVGDTLFGAIPFVGILSGYIFHAEYLMTNPNGDLLYTIKKKPALIESNFEIYANTNEGMSLPLLQITLMAIMRERFRS